MSGALDILLRAEIPEPQTKAFKHKRLSMLCGEDVAFTLRELGFSRVADIKKLHEGERVLTASEARAYREGGAGVTVQMNGATIREEADINKIAQALFEELRRAQMVS